MKYLLLAVLFSCISLSGLQAQQLGAEEDTSSPEADAELQALLKNQNAADTTFVKLRFGLFGPSAKTRLEEGQRWASQGRLNIALAYFYRCLDKNSKKTNEPAKQGILTYGPKFLAQLADGSIKSFDNGDGRAGNSYAFRIIREIRAAKKYGITLAVEPKQLAQLNKSATDWSERRFVELEDLVAKRKHFTLAAELEKTITYVPEARKSPAYARLLLEVNTNGIRRLALPTFQGYGQCEKISELVQLGFSERIANYHPLIQLVSREINDQLGEEKVLAELDDRPLTSELKANLQGADYLVVGKMVSCEENQSPINQFEVEGYQARTFKYKDAAGEEQTGVAYDLPIKMVQISGTSSVRYTVAISIYRVADGKLIQTKKFDDTASSAVDCIYSPNGATDVSVNKVEANSGTEVQRFKKKVFGERQAPVQPAVFRQEIAKRFENILADTVFASIKQDN